MKAVFRQTPEDILRDVEKYREHLEVVQEELDRLRAKWDIFACEGFIRFREKVLLPEIDRLAKKRMSFVDPENIRENLLIQGQWNEAVYLAEQPDRIKERLKLLEKDELETSQKLASTQKRLDKALGGK